MSVTNLSDLMNLARYSESIKSMKGGAGSGNHGHSGRVGQRGGSSKDSISNETETNHASDIYQELQQRRRMETENAADIVESRTKLQHQDASSAEVAIGRGEGWTDEESAKDRAVQESFTLAKKIKDNYEAEVVNSHTDKISFEDARNQKPTDKFSPSQFVSSVYTLGLSDSHTKTELEDIEKKLHNYFPVSPNYRRFKTHALSEINFKLSQMEQ